MNQQEIDIMSIHWPEMITLDANIKSEEPFMTVDGNTVKFAGAHGTASYIIDESLLKDNILILRRQNGITV